MPARKQSWGSLRKLPSGRYQARYRADGKLVSADTTFRTKRDAETYLATVRADMERGQWVNPTSGKIPFREYATKWLEQRPDLRPRTQELYEGELRLHILPVLGDIELSKLTPSKVREWHSGMLGAPKPGPPTVAKCYRLLRVILNTAVADELIVKNPCVIRGAGVEKAAERPTVPIEQVYEIADAIEDRFRAMILTATFTGLRLGEMRALTRERVDLLHGTIKVIEQYQELKDGTLVLGPPKSDAGVRTVAIPAILKPELETHLAEWAAPGKKGLVFCGTNDQALRRATFYTAWDRAMTALGIEGIKPHDLRHTGNTLAATAGASTKELMARMGHASPRAALIYQHASEERDHEIAGALSDMIEKKLKQRPTGTDGPTPIG